MGVYSNQASGIDLFTESEEMQAFQEVYFGETSEIKELITAMGDFRDDYLPKQKGKTVKYNPTINSSEKLQKVNRLIEKIFGFKTFSLHIIDSKLKNAMTYPLYCDFDTTINSNKAMLKPTSKGYKYDPKYGLVAITYITTGMIGNTNYTDREIVAIILHEIGHNFQHTISKGGAQMAKANKAIIAIAAIISIFSGNVNKGTIPTEFQFTKDIKANGGKYMRDNFEFVMIFYDYMQTVNNVLRDLGMNLISLLSPILNVVSIPIAFLQSITKYLNPFSAIATVTGYKAEQTADAFTAAYGLGPDLQTALIKMDTLPANKVEEIQNKIPIVRGICRLSSVPVEMAASIGDVHPTTPTRALSNIEVLRSDLKDADPKMAKLIKDDIDKIEATMDEVCDEAKAASAKDPYRFKKKWFAFIYKTKEGDNRKGDYPDRLARDLKETFEEDKVEESGILTDAIDAVYFK